MLDARRKPKLRQLDRHTISRDGEELVVLRDPMALSEPMAVDAEFGQVLDLFDGQRTLAQIRQSLLMTHELDVPVADLAAFADELAEAGFLDDETFRAKWLAIFKRWLDDPVRAPHLAGVAYPDDPELARALMDAALPRTVARTRSGSNVVACVIPHQPPDAAAEILDAALRDLPAPDDLEVVVVLGTDHHPAMLPCVTTVKQWATPLGPIQPHAKLIAALERRVPWVRREEIRFRTADAIELALLSLRHVYGDACPPILPLACSAQGLSERTAKERDEVVAALDGLLEDRAVLFLVAAELSHAGPAYRRGPLDTSLLEEIEGYDRGLIEPLLQGRTGQFSSRCREDGPQGRASGAFALDVLARLLPVGHRAELADYRLLPAPGRQDGRIGAVGLRFRRA
jgi:AmmeMemoRadiSam system protein B